MERKPKVNEHVVKDNIWCFICRLHQWECKCTGRPYETT